MPTLAIPATLIKPRTVVEKADGNTLRIRFQDAIGCEDLAVVEYPLEFAATLAAEIASIAPPGAKPKCFFRLDHDRLGE
jgi:hypothetical protein